MPNSLVFRFPLPPNLTNRKSGGSHWAIRGREKREYLAECDRLQLLGALPAPPTQAATRIELSAVLHLGGHMDDDNAMARCKWPLDWLKTRGYIVDDRRKNVRWAGLPEQVVKRNQDRVVVLTLTPVAA